MEKNKIKVFEKTIAKKIKFLIYQAKLNIKQFVEGRIYVFEIGLFKW